MQSIPHVSSWLSLLAVLYLSACCCQDPNKSGATPTGTTAAPVAAPAQPVLTVDIQTLLGDYKNNEVSSDIKYKDKLVRVSGKVDDIKKDLMDNIYVTVGTGQMFEIPQVQAFVVKDSVGRAAALSKGQTVTVVGRIDGLMMNVLMRDARIE